MVNISDTIYELNDLLRTRDMIHRKYDVETNEEAAEFLRDVQEDIDLLWSLIHGRNTND